MAKTILVLAANPKNTPPLRLDQEVREIDNGLERAQKREEFILKQKLAARPVDVRRAMLDYKPNIEAVQWFVVHVLPVIQKKIPEVRFYIVGSRPDQAVKSLEKQLFGLQSINLI